MQWLFRMKYKDSKSYDFCLNHALWLRPRPAPLYSNIYWAL